MPRLTALIVDDEAHARRRLRRLLEVIPGVVVIAEAENGEEALVEFQRTRPDAIFLDVVMPGCDGLEAARRMAQAGLVYVTAHDQYAVEAFDLDAVDYLLKPVRRERLERAVGRLFESIEARRNDDPARSASPSADKARPLVARWGGSRYLLDPRNIARFRADAKYIVVTHGGTEYLLDESLDRLEVVLEKTLPGAYLRIHRAELVRLDAVKALHQGVQGPEVELHDGQRARVSRRRVARLRECLGV